MYKLEVIGRLVAWIITIWILLFFGWNQFMPVIGFQKIDILQALGLVIMICIPTATIATIWNAFSHNTPSQVVYYVPQPENNESDQ